MMSPDDAPIVMSYRLGEVEKKVDAILNKFDMVAQHYVSHASLMLILDPLKDRVKDLEKNEQSRETRRSNESSQFKLAMAIAIFSPIFSAFISIVVVTMIGK